MNFKTTVWTEGDWGLWRHNTMKSDRGSWGKYMLFHNCSGTEGNYNEHRVAKDYNETYGCAVCMRQAPDGAVAILELMNWEEE